LQIAQRSRLVLPKGKLLTWANIVYDWSERLIWIWNWDSKWTHCCWEVFDIIPHNASFLRRWLQRSTLCCGANFYLNIHSRVFLRKSSIEVKVLGAKHMYSKNTSLKDKKKLCESQVTQPLVYWATHYMHCKTVSILTKKQQKKNTLVPEVFLDFPEPRMQVMKWRMRKTRFFFLAASQLSHAGKIKKNLSVTSSSWRVIEEEKTFIKLQITVKTQS